MTPSDCGSRRRCVHSLRATASMRRQFQLVDSRANGLSSGNCDSERLDRMLAHSVRASPFGVRTLESALDARRPAHRFHRDTTRATVMCEPTSAANGPIQSVVKPAHSTERRMYQRFVYLPQTFPNHSSGKDEG